MPLRSSDTAGWALGAAALLGLACIDVAQIRGPIGSKSGPPDASDADVSDAATDPVAPVDAVSGSVLFGSPCDRNEDCADGSCVDHVCCRLGSCPVCQVCATDGNCVRVGAGIVEPHFRCHPPDAPESCGKSGACDGMGACAYYPSNVECSKGTCSGDAVVGALVCNGRGQCVPAATRICVPFKCAAGTCNDTCTADEECAASNVCVRNSCGSLGQGAACQTNEQCLSHFCADGVCCNVSCQGPCVSCNLLGAAGMCSPTNANDPDPRAICVDKGPTSCGSTGVCDGAGGCLRYNVTTVCGHTCAADGSTLMTSYCDGYGACRPTTTVLPCPTNTCDADIPVCR